MPYTYNPFENNLDYYQASSGGTVIGPGSSVNGNLVIFSGTSGQTLADSGVNLHSTGNITITNAQIKSLRSIPVEIIPAQGAGKIISIVCATVKFNYGGNNAFVSGGNLQLMVNNTSGILYSAWNSAIYTGTVDKIYGIIGPQANGATTQGVLENLPIVLSTASADPTGNASNDNTLTVNVLYQILTL